MPRLHFKPAIVQQRLQFAFSKAVDEHFGDVAIRGKPISQFTLASGHVEQVFGEPAPTAGMAKLLPEIVGVQHKRTSVFDRPPRVIQKLPSIVTAGNHAQRTEQTDPMVAAIVSQCV